MTDKGISFLTGGGDMGARIRAHDWRTSSLGPPDKWPQSLRSMLTLCVNSPIVSAVHWGPELLTFYNDAYAPALAERHPSALGKPFSAVWAEIWDVLGPQIDMVLETGRGFSTDHQLLKMKRRGRIEDTWWVYSFAPLHGDDGKAAGIFVSAFDVTEAHVSGQALRDSEARFRALVNATSDVVYQMNADWTELRQLDGRGFLADNAAPSIKWLDEYVLLEDRPHLLAVIDRAVQTKGVFELQHRVRQADGRIGWTLSRAVPLLDEAGRIIEWFGMAADVTERVRAEEDAARASQRLASERDQLVVVEQRLQLALSAGRGIGTWEWDVPSDRVFADERFAHLYGVDPERAKTGAPIAEFFGGIHPDDVDRVQASVAATVRTGGFFSEEYRLLLAGGSSFWVVAEGRCELDEKGQARRFAGVSFDISERKAEERRRKAVADLADRIRDVTDPGELALQASMILGELLEVSRASYGTIDPEAETLTVERDYLAPRIESLAGTLHLRDYGTFIDDLKAGKFIVIPDVRTDPRTAAAAQALIGQSAAAFVNVPVLERGKLVAVLFLNNATPREWSEADLALVLEIAERTRTATERLRAVEGLRLANETLESRITDRTKALEAAGDALRQAQKMEAVGQLTGGIAHDFNNLLTGISGSLELIERRISQGRLESVNRYITLARESSARAATLTQRLLAFARRQTLAPRVVDMNQVIAGMAHLLDRSVGPDVEVVVVAGRDLWNTRLDSSQLENAILNLCINARDAMAPTGGRITIETANVSLEDRLANAHRLPPGPYVLLSVTDTGAGMTEEVIEKAFDPFFTTKPLGQGTGLGLSMIYGFARQSGGRVHIVSEVGRGTTMCLYFPKFNGEADATELEQDQTIDRGTGETVLIIDDEAAIRLLVADTLRESGYAVLEAEDGASGLRVLEGATRVDVLVTDVGLPGGLNGRQVADAARAARPNLKVIFITGFAENAAVGEGHLEAGMTVLTKPFVMSALANKVREIIDL